MLAIIVIIFMIVIIGSLIYYVTGIDFEMGTGFTEEKNKAREGEYHVVDKDTKNTETKLLT